MAYLETKWIHLREIITRFKYLSSKNEESYGHWFNLRHPALLVVHVQVDAYGSSYELKHRSEQQSS